MTLAEKILELRTARGLSQGDLAEQLEVSRQSVSKWETGQSVPDLDKIIRLSDLFGVSVDELVREGERPAPEVSTPEVIYVEKKRGLTPAQMTGIVLEVLGVVLIYPSSQIWVLLAALGVVFMILGLPLLLAKKYPFLIFGWMLAAISILVLNPAVVNIRLCTVLWSLWHGGLYEFTFIPLARDLLVVGMFIATWRTFRKKKDVQKENP